MMIPDIMPMMGSDITVQDQLYHFLSDVTGIVYSDSADNLYCYSWAVDSKCGVVIVDSNYVQYKPIHEILYTTKDQTGLWFHRGSKGEDCALGHLNEPAVLIKRGNQRLIVYAVDGEIHRAYGPAILVQEQHGKEWFTTRKVWMQHGKPHHEFGPASIKYMVRSKVPRFIPFGSRFRKHITVSESWWTEGSFDLSVWHHDDSGHPLGVSRGYIPTRRTSLDISPYGGYDGELFVLGDFERWSKENHIGHLGGRFHQENFVSQSDWLLFMTEFLPNIDPETLRYRQYDE